MIPDSGNTSRSSKLSAGPATMSMDDLGIDKILNEIGTPVPVPDDSTDRRVLDEQKLIDRDMARAHLLGLRQDIAERKAYATKIYRLVVWWLVAVFVLLMAVGLKWFPFYLSDKVMLAVIGGTTVNVIGLFAIVANYLFHKPGTSTHWRGDKNPD